MILFIGGGSVAGIVRTQLYVDEFVKAGKKVCVISYFPKEHHNCISLKYRETPTPESIVRQLPKRILNKLKFVTTVFDVYIDVVGALNSYLKLPGVSSKNAEILKSKTRSITSLCEDVPEDFELLPFYTENVPKDLPVILKPESGTGAIRFNELCYKTVVNPELKQEGASTFGDLVAQKKWQGDQTIYGLNYYHDGFKLHRLFASNIVKDETYQLVSLKKIEGECPQLDSWRIIQDKPFGLFFNIQCFFNIQTGKFLPFDINSRFSAVTHECIKLIDPSFMESVIYGIKKKKEIPNELKVPWFCIEQTSDSLPPEFIPITNKIPPKEDPTYRPPISCYVGENYDKTPISSK